MTVYPMFIIKKVILDYITKFKIVYFNLLLCLPFNDKQMHWLKPKLLCHYNLLLPFHSLQISYLNFLIQCTVQIIILWRSPDKPSTASCHIETSMIHHHLPITDDVDRHPMTCHTFQHVKVRVVMMGPIRYGVQGITIPNNNVSIRTH